MNTNMITTLLKYGNTNTYLIKGKSEYILFDTDWAGTVSNFFKALGELSIRAQDIQYVVISHFHPDHMGIAQEIANLGAAIAAVDFQKDFFHFADSIFAKDNSRFVPIDDSKVKIISIEESRAFLAGFGINGELLATPGHSDDSISLYLDDGSLFVGDLNPLYEKESYEGTLIAETWEKLMKLNPKQIFYGHAKSAMLGD